MDTQTHENNQFNEVGAASRGISVGATLREAREQQGLSIDEVSGRIKFAPRQIAGLEADDYSAIPEGAFLRGFVRSYARMLQLDEKALIASLPCASPVAEVLSAAVVVDVPLPRESDERKVVLFRGAAAVAAVILLGLSAWALFGSHGSRVDDTPPAASAPVAAPVVDAEPAAQEPVPVAAVSAVAQGIPQVEPAAQSAAVVAEPPLRLVFVESSWAEVRDKHGAMLMSQRNAAGSEQSFQGDAPFYVAIARVSGVKLYFKGKQVDLAPNTTNGSARLKLE